jgi:hypothetical protein
MKLICNVLIWRSYGDQLSRFEYRVADGQEGGCMLTLSDY